MSNRTLSIRTMFSLLVLAMGLLLVISSLERTVEALNAVRQSKRVETVAELSRILFGTFVSTRNERSSFIATSLSDLPATVPQKTRIAVNRAISERGYNQVVAGLAGVTDPALSAARDRLVAEHEAMAALRRRIDVEILLPKTKREPTLAADAPRIAGDYVAAQVALSTRLESSIETDDPMVEYYLHIKQAAAAVRNYGGLVTLRIEHAVALGQGWGLADIDAAAMDSGRAAFAWSQVTAAVRRPGVPQSLRGLVARGDLYFNGPAAEERAALIQVLSTGGKIETPLYQLIERDVSDLDSIVAVANGALDGMVRHAQARRDHADVTLLLSALQALVALGLAAAGFLYVYFRISRPLKRMTRVMGQLAWQRADLALSGRAGLEFAMPYTERQDEIGDTARSLELLRRSLIEKLELSRLERERSEQLHRAEKDLIEAEKLAALGRLVAGIAHEINTPIGSALTVATTLHDQEAELSRKFDGGQGRMQRRDLEDFLGNVRLAAEIQIRALGSAATLVRNFKQVAVDQAGEQRRYFLLGELVEQVISTLLPSFKHTPHRIVAAIDPGIAMDSFPGPLGQVVTNLLANSLVHGFDGRDAGTVTVAAETEGGTVRLSVEDDGHGIAARHLPHIFEPFYTTRFGQGGSGLGLHIVHSLVTAVLGGTVTVSTREGEGTCFVLTLPLKAERPVAAS